MKQNETLKSLTPAQMIPTDCEYTFRCVEESFGISKSSGSMMITRELELDSPATVKIDGEEYGVSGIKLRQYLVTMKSDGKSGFDQAGTRVSMGRVFEDYKKLGSNLDDIDPENPMLIAKGKLIRYTLRNEPFTFTEQLTPADVAAGKKVGKPIVGEDGKPKTGFKVVLGYLQGLAS